MPGGAELRPPIRAAAAGCEGNRACSQQLPACSARSNTGASDRHPLEVQLEGQLQVGVQSQLGEVFEEELQGELQAFMKKYADKKRAKSKRHKEHRAHRAAGLPIRRLL